MKYVFVHIPKCAGTSVHNFLLQTIPDCVPCPIRFNTLHDVPVEELEKYTLFSGHMDFASVKRIPGEKKTILTLREPKSRIVSVYKYWRSFDLSYAYKNNVRGSIAAHSLPFVEFLRHQKAEIQHEISNGIVRQLLGRSWSDDSGALVIDEQSAVEVALRNLKTIDFVGFSDNLAPLFASFARHLGQVAPHEILHVNESPTYEDNSEFTSDEAMDLLEKLTTADSKLYKEAKQLVCERSRLEKSSSRFNLKLPKWKLIDHTTSQL